MQKPFWFTLSLIVAMLFLSVLSACGPTEAEKNVTATAYYATSDALKNSYFLTQTAAPPRTPAPTSTPDNRSSFEKCAQSGSGVRYVISGKNVSAVSLTFENDTGGTDQGDYNVPVCKTYRGFQPGDFLYISAQITSGSGSIKCQIYDGSILIAEGNASGFASIATCSGSAK